MADLKGKKQKQPSSCPDGWLTAALVVQLELTRRQEKYARRAVGIARFVYNRMVANDQAGRDTGLWLTPHELEKEFNSVKQTNPSLAFTTQVSKFVAQGACRNYRNAHSRWRNKQLKSRKPTFHKKRLTGTGSFLAASGVNCIKYDGHRRIRLPYLGSVKLTRELREGIPYEVTLRRRNGRWYASVAYWKPPVQSPCRETQSAGGVDVGINPLAMDSDGVSYQNPHGYYQAQRRLRRWQRSQARRIKGSRGWWQAQRRIDAVHRRIVGLRNNAHHHVSRALVAKYHTLGIETLNVKGNDQGRPSAQSPVRRRHVQPSVPDTLQGPVARYSHRPGKPQIPQQQDLLNLQQGEQETSQAAHMDLSQLRRQPRPQRKCSLQPA